MRMNVTEKENTIKSALSKDLRSYLKECCMNNADNQNNNEVLKTVDEDIQENATLWDLFCTMTSGNDVCKLIGNNSSYRHLCLKKLAAVFNVDYSIIFNIWASQGRKTLGVDRISFVNCI